MCSWLIDIDLWFHGGSMGPINVEVIILCVFIIYLHIDSDYILQFLILDMLVVSYNMF